MEQSDTGPPNPVTTLTLEQQFKMKAIEQQLEKASREDLITVFMALQHQTFVLGNNLKNLLSKWPRTPAITAEVKRKFGTLFENKD